MKKSFNLGLIFMALTFNATADECTKDVDGYLQGLELGISLPQVSVKAKNIANTKITRIEALRKSKTDCEIIAFIPELSQSKLAIKRATEFSK